MRSSHSHAANREKEDPFSNSTCPTPVQILPPSLEPVGSIPKYAIEGDYVERGHNLMTKRFRAREPPLEPRVIEMHWVEMAKIRWGRGGGILSQ
eukprot:5779380-Karenia_brevis.AAC.1